MRKHYASKHPSVNFEQDFRPPKQSGASVSVPQVPQVDNKAQQEALFAKVKLEMEGQLQQNLSKIETEIGSIKTKQTSLMTTMDKTQVLETQQAQLQKDLEKPNRMLDEMRNDFERLLEGQTSQMRDLVHKTVADSLKNRVDDKVTQQNAGMSSETQKFYESKLKEFEVSLVAKDQEIQKLKLTELRKSAKDTEELDKLKSQAKQSEEALQQTSHQKAMQDSIVAKLQAEIKEALELKLKAEQELMAKEADHRRKMIELEADANKKQELERQERLEAERRAIQE